MLHVDSQVPIMGGFIICVMHLLSTTFTEMMSACVIGSTYLAIECSEKVHHLKGISVKHVFTDDSAFREWAKSKSIPASNTDKFCKRSSEFFSQFDFLFSIVNDIIVPSNILDAIKSHAINYHNGPLPKYSGINAAQWALINGEKQHGVTWHIMKPQVDCGPIVVQEHFDIAEDDDISTVTWKCRDAALRSLDYLCDALLSKSLVLRRHSLDDSTHHSFAEKPSAFCVIPFYCSAKDIWNFFRSTSTLGLSQENLLGLPKICVPSFKEPFIIKSLTIHSTSSDAPPGTVMDVGKNIRVATEDKDIIIVDLVSMDGTHIPKPFNLFFPQIRLHSISLSSAHDKSSSLFQTSYLSGKYERSWVKRQSASDSEPPMSWPYKTYGKATSEKVENLYITVPLQTFDNSLITSFLQLLPESSPEVAVLSVFMTHILSLSPTLSGSVDTYCSELPKEHAMFLLRALPVSLKLVPKKPFIVNLSMVYKSLKSVVHGNVKSGVRQDLVAADVYLRYPGILFDPRNTLALSALSADENIEDFVVSNATHEVVLLTKFQATERTVSLVAKVKPVSSHKYIFDRVSHDFDTFLFSAMKDPLKISLQSLTLSTSDCLAEIQSVLTGKKTEISVMAIHKPIEDHAGSFPYTISIVDKFSSSTCGDILKRSNDIACYFKQLGITNGSVVGLLFDRTWEVIAAMLGILKIGASFSFLVVDHPPRALAYILQNSKANAILVDEVGSKAIEKLTNELNAEDIKELPQLLTIQTVYLGSLPEIQEEIASFTPNANDPAVIVSTSGSTGRPKSVMLKHSSICNYLTHVINTFELKPTQIANGMVEVGEYSLAQTSFIFDGCLHEIFTTLWVGGTLIFHPSNPAEKSRCKLFFSHITYLFSQPTKLLMFKASAFPSVLNLSIGGEPFALELVKPWHAPGRKIWNVYGPCETTIGCTIGRCENTIHLGYPIANVSLKILNPLRQPLPLGVPGELHIGGMGVSLGYTDPKLSKEAFWKDQSENTWYSTRDLVLLDSNYNIRFLNRIHQDRQAKFHGIRIELAGIEYVLRHIPYVQFALVQIEKVSDKYERLVAYVTPEHLDPNMIEEALRKELPSFLIPSLIFPVPFSSIQFLPSGKLKLIRSDAIKVANMPAQYVPAITDLEEKVLKKYCEALVVKETAFGMKSSFSAFGGDSVSAIHLSLDLSLVLGVQVTPKDIFKAQTPEKILHMFEGKHGSSIAISTCPVVKKRERTVSNFQEALASMNSLDIGPTYNAACILRVSGNVNGLHLASSLEKVLQLLSAACMVGKSRGATDSLKLSDNQYHVAHIDLSSIPLEQALRNVRREIQLDAVIPVSFSNCPYRCKLYYLGNSGYMISVIMHHIVFDQDTMQNFGKALESVYNNPLCSPCFSRDFVPYSEFVSHEEEMNTWEKSKSEKFWKVLLKDCTPFIGFPTSFHRTYPLRYYGNTLMFHLPKEIHSKLLELLSELDVRPVSFFLAMYGLLISKLSNSHSFAVGVSLSLRSSPKLKKVFGMVLNVIPCVFSQAALEGSSLKDLVCYVSEQFWKSLEHRYFPFLELVKIWGRDSKQSHMPQFLYNFSSKTQSPNIKLGTDIQTEKEDVSTYTAKAEILLDVRMSSHSLCEFSWEYNTTLFSRCAVKNIAEHYIHLISLFIENTDSTIGSICPITSDLQCFEEPQTSPFKPKCDATEQKLTEHQMAIYKACAYCPINLHYQWHSKISINIDSKTKTEAVLKAMLTFPYLNSIVKVKNENDIYLVGANEVSLRLHCEDVSSDDVTGIKYRLWAWPFDILGGSLFRCAILNHTDSEQTELFCVAHQILLDEDSLYFLSNKLLEMLCNSKSSVPGILIDTINTKSDTDVDLKKYFLCQKSLPPLNTSHLQDSSHCVEPAVFRETFEIDGHAREDFVSLCCMFSLILIDQLQVSSHVHVALLSSSSCSSLSSNEKIIPICMDVHADATLQKMLEEIRSTLSNIYLATDEPYSYWTMQERENPLNSYMNPYHEVLVKVSSYSGVHQIDYPRPFALCLSFNYDSREAALTSHLSFQQTKLAQDCFRVLLRTLPSVDKQTTFVSQICSEVSLCPSIVNPIQQHPDLHLPSMITSAFNQFSYSIAACETQEQVHGVPSVYTYQELKYLAESLAVEMGKALGKQAAQSLIAILVEGGVALPLCMLASFLRDNPITVLDGTRKIEELEAKLSSIPVSLLLVDLSLLEVLNELSLNQSSPVTCIIVDPYFVPAFPKFPIVSTREPSRLLDNTFVSDTAFLVFTSGSTGKPKPTPVLKKSLTNFIGWFISRSVHFSEPLQWIQYSGHSFDILVAELLTQFLCGGTLVLIDHRRKLDMGYTLSKMKQYHIQAIFLVPTTLRLMLNSALFTAKNLPNLMHVFTTGEKLSNQLCSRFFQCFPPGGNQVLLHNWGGPSECCIGVVHSILNEEPSLSVVPYGAPVCDCEIQVVSLNTRKPVPLGYPGEMLISGAPVFNGYANPDICPPFLSKDGRKWYCSGDIVYLTAKQQVVFLCRYDQQVKLSGQRVDLDGIKRQILNLGLEYLVDIILDVMDVCDTKLLVCFLLVRENFARTEDEVLCDLSLIPSKFVPQVVRCVTEYPLLASQKVDLQSLRAFLTISRQNSAESSCLSPSKELMKAVKQVNPVLHQIDPLFSLDALGFNSIMKAQLYQKLVDLGYDCSLSLILASRSLQDLWNRMFYHQTSTQELALIYPESPLTANIEEKAVTAIIGMHIEVAGASTCDEFWDILFQRKETISHNLPQDPQISEEVKHSTAQYVGSRGLLLHSKLFDACLFGVPPSEARYLDPQQRLLLQGVWTALEQAGYDSVKFSEVGKIGVFAGVEFPSYMFNLLNQNITRGQIVWHTLRDNVALRIGRAFNFQGPCVTIANNCSTFLVGLHYANQSLLNKECDIAVVAAATVSGQMSGYIASEHDIYSKDGHCCPFSSSASGTVMSDGLTVIVLRRLSDALENSDDIVCLVMGTSVGSDGSLVKERQLRPSSAGQLQVLQQLFRLSGIAPSSIGFVEAHGTGTKVGDQIELESLNSLFNMDLTNTGRKCPLGSVKGNIGHLGVTAAGPGIIKAALALHHSKIPATINCMNPIKNLATSHFYVNSEEKDWVSQGNMRRALVHSVGAMGSNAAIILEEYEPIHQNSVNVGTNSQQKDVSFTVPLCISANSMYSLKEFCHQLEASLVQTPTKNIRDVAYTLLSSRRFLPFRITNTCSSITEFQEWLSAVPHTFCDNAPNSTANKMLCVMFSGQGSLINPTMFSVLSDCLPGFKDEMSRHIHFLSNLNPEILHGNLYSLLSSKHVSEQAKQLLKNPSIQNSLLVAAQIGMYNSLCKLGLHADCFVGHSLGEYTAACLAGAYIIEDILEIVFKRGVLIEEYAPEGKMLSVSAPVEKVKQICSEYGSLELSCINSPQHCVLSGPPDTLELVCTVLSQAGVEFHLLQMEYSFHHSCLRPIQKEYEKVLQLVKSHPLERALVTCSQGETELHHVGSTVSNNYWINHLVTPCDFATALQLLPSEDCNYVEIGLKPTLVYFMDKRHVRPISMTPPQHSLVTQEYFIRNLSEVWKTGMDILLHKLPCFAGAKKVKLPTYCFDLQEHWVDSAPLSVIRHTSFKQEEKDFAKPQPATVEEILEIISAFAGPSYQDILPQDSLTLVSLGNRLYNKFNVDVTELLLQDKTPMDIAKYIAEECDKSHQFQMDVASFNATQSRVCPSLVLLASPSDESCPAAFIINAVNGNKVHSFTPLAHILSPFLKVYGLYVPTSIFNLGTVEDYAELYLKEMNKVQSRGPFIIGGFSFGAWVAHSIVKKLETLGEKVQLLFMIDPPYMTLRSTEAQSFPQFAHSLITFGIESIRSFTHNPVKETITAFGQHFLTEANLLQQYQHSPVIVRCLSVIFVAKDRAAFETSSGLSSENWTQWCKSDTLTVELIPGQHSTCISALNCHHVAVPLLKLLGIGTKEKGSTHQIPVCSPHEVAGEWKLAEFISPLVELTSSGDGILRLSTERQYTFMIPRLQSVVSYFIIACWKLVMSSYFVV